MVFGITDLDKQYILYSKQYTKHQYQTKAWGRNLNKCCISFACSDPQVALSIANGIWLADADANCSIADNIPYVFRTSAYGIALTKLNKYEDKSQTQSILGRWCPKPKFYIFNEVIQSNKIHVVLQFKITWNINYFSL